MPPLPITTQSPKGLGAFAITIEGATVTSFDRAGAGMSCSPSPTGRSNTEGHSVPSHRRTWTSRTELRNRTMDRSDA